MRIATLQLESKALSAAERTTLSTRIDARLKAAAADKTAIAIIKTAKKPTDTNIVTNFFPKFFLFFMFIFLLSAKGTNALCFGIFYHHSTPSTKFCQYLILF